VSIRHSRENHELVTSLEIVADVAVFQRMHTYQQEEKHTLMFIFKLFMALQVALYRLSGGKLGGEMRGFKVLLLTTTGRKSGKIRTAPLGFFERQGGYVIVASNGGQPTHPAWYHNLKSHPGATVQILDKIIPVAAEILTGEARAQAWQQVITAAPLYENYQKHTVREIPLVLLQPGQ
jgi:deazaflavin-dependent oxidoreductase (nitroreductase family)